MKVPEAWKIKRGHRASWAVWSSIVLFFAIVTGVALAGANLIYLGVALAPLVLYFCMEKPFIFPFGVYAFLIPFDEVLSTTESGHGATLTRFLGIMTILTLTLKIIFEDKLARPGSAALWSVLLVLFGLLSAVWAIDPALVISLLPTAAGLLLMYLVAGSYRLRKSEFETLEWCIFAGGFLAAIYVIYNFMTGSFFYDTSRVSMVVGDRISDPNYFAYTLIMPVAVCIHMMLNRKEKALQALFLVTLGVIIFGVIVTGSRGGMIGVLSVLAVYLMATDRKIVFTTGIIAVAVVLLQFIPDMFFARINEGIETGGAGRVDVLYVVWKALEKYWLFGAGMSNCVKAFSEFYIYSPSFRGHEMGAHNLYLGTFVELGVAGFALLAVMIVKHYRMISVKLGKNSEDIMISASFWGTLVTSFFLDPMFRKSFWLLWMMILMYGNIKYKRHSDQVVRTGAREVESF
ncbi:MAG: hypothetical protein C4560_09650 [Nitrospiraceae bacterium]|nr:MAG: hypothetical protein C4560_09650 [Nitrospiraceae bacterium]